MGKNKANRLLAVVIGIITVIGLIAAVRADNATRQLDKSTPEGTVQAYLTSVVTGDYESAIKHISPASSCTVTDLDNSYFAKDVRISLVDSHTTSSGGVVKINVEVPSGGPIGSYYSEEHTIRLVKGNQGWRITGIPWPMYACGTANQ